MLRVIPGTVLPWEEGLSRNAFAVLSPVLSVTKGLTLSQLRELTGLEGTTIQNWVKRGWIESPTGKRYGEQQILRVILINMLRNAMQLDKIIWLMGYINGRVDDRSDDIIPDRELFNVLCRIIYLADRKQTTDKTEIRRIIGEELEHYNGPCEDSKEKLEKAVLCMTLGFISSEIKKQSDEAFEGLYQNRRGDLK